MKWNLFVVLALVLSACGGGKEDHDGHDHSQESKAGQHEEHGPNGGELIELGAHAAHLEILHDEKTGALTLHALDGDMKPLDLDAPPVLNLAGDDGVKQLEGKAPGMSRSTYIFQDPALKGHAHGARFRVKVKGVTYTPELPHHHEEDGDHDDHDGHDH